MSDIHIETERTRAHKKLCAQIYDQAKAGSTVKEMAAEFSLTEATIRGNIRYHERILFTTLASGPIPPRLSRRRGHPSIFGSIT